MSEMNSLPKGWSMGTLPDLISDGIFTDGDWVESKDQDPSGSIRLLQLADIGDGYFVDKSSRYMNPETADYLNCTFLQKNDVLVARMPDPLGRACLMPTIEQKAVTVVDVCVIRDKPQNFHSPWLMYFINSPDFRNEIASLQSGSTRKRISRGNLSKIRFPIPPRKEQTRIVEKLEELLSDLDNGVAELKAAQNKLNQYRQSLLKSAVEGSLTAEWRKQNPVTETGEQLLQRILIERRQRWEQQKLAEFKEKGKAPPKDWQKKYPEPVQPNTSELPELPVGWVWASVAQLCEIQGGIQKQPKRAPLKNKYPFLRVANVYRNELKLDVIHEIELFDGELERLKLFSGDILIVEGNGSKSEIGRCALWNDSIINAVHQNHLIRARPILIDNTFLLNWLNSPSGMDIMSRLAATTSGLYTLSVSKISKIPVPLAPYNEQKVISGLLSAGFEEFDSKSETIDASLKQSEAQRKNILKEAFSGKLVPQDPNDEPASVLLEKIKAERLAQAKLPKPKRTKKKANDKASIMDTLFEVLKAKGDWMDAQEAFRACGVTDGGDFSDIVDKVESLYAELRKLEKEEQLIEIRRVGNYDQLKLRNGNAS